jgi:hypothetical protein
VRVEDPYGLRHPGRAPLLVGTYVRAVLPGKRIPDLFLLPDDAIRGGGEVLVIDGEDRLRKRKVEVVRRERDGKVVCKGLAGDERICLTALENALDGMSVRVAEEPGS